MEILLKNVSKQYGGKKVVDNIDIHISSGKIYGFIGLNGAGKTTTMRMMTGLTPLSSGKITFDGKTLEELPDRYSAFGAFISTPSYYKNLTSFENLALIQKVIKQPISEVDRVLELVGLRHAKKVRVSEFSFGMKQRLGLAFAFLNNPDILILDEPTNGLDPKGIMEIRELLYYLANTEGKTIFISSHNIAELEQISDLIGIINQGKMIFEGTLDELYNQKGISYQIEVDNEEEAILFFQVNHIPFERYRKTFELRIHKQEIPYLLRKMQNEGIQLYEIIPNKNLERIFLDLTREEK